MNRKCLIDGIKNRALPLALFTVWALYIFGLYQFKLWAWVGVPHMEPLFADLHAILSAAECHDRGLNVFVTNPCDALGRIHVYGSLWLNITRLGLNPSHLVPLGIFVDLIFMALAVFLIAPQSSKQVALTCLILFSPAVTLALERANNDLIVFALTACSAILISFRHRIATLSSLCLIYLSSVLKIYPSVLFGTILLVVKRRPKELILIVGVSSFLIACWLITNLNEILLLKDLVPKPLDHYTTGAKTLFIYLGRPYPQILLIPETWRLITFAGFIAMCAWWLAGRLTFAPMQASKLSFKYTLFVFGLSILFFTYTVNSNYDYRWIFFILLIPYLFCLQQASAKNPLARKMVALSFICALLVLWTEALRAGNFFGVLRFNIYFNIGRSTFSIELIQQFLKELSAWLLFIILFAFAIKQFSKR
jgi:hypothetical protein